MSGTLENKDAAVKSSGDIYQLLFDEDAKHHRVHFHDPEPVREQTFCWSQPLAMVRLDIPAADYRVIIDTAGIRGDRCKFPFQLRWNNHKIPQHEIQIEQGKISFNVKQVKFAPATEQRITISCRPLKAGAEKRVLGMPVASVSLVPMGAGGKNTAPTSTDAGNWIRHRSLESIRHLLGKGSPSPYLPIWSMQLSPAHTVVQRAQPTATQELAKQPQRKLDNAVISAVEINSRHGTGLLIQYLFGDFDQLATVCSRQIYHGERISAATHHDLSGFDLKRHEVYAQVLKWFGDHPPKRTYAVPFFESDLLIALAMKDLFGTKICLHFMDDTNIYGSEISNAVMEEALDRADLVLSISPEMRNAYEGRYGHKMYVMPPIVPDELIQRANQAINSDERVTNASERGILIGNIWDTDWLNLLRTTIRESGCQVDWYANNPNLVVDEQPLHVLKDELAADGIFLHDALWGESLVEELRRRPFAIMPSGTLADGEATQNIARLSLPSRIPYTIATSQLPIIVLGSAETASAKFVNRFDLGHRVDYEGQQFREAVESICRPELQTAIRNRAAELAPTFSAAGVQTWLWESLEKGEPADDRFEKLFATQSSEFAYFIDPTPPSDLHWGNKPVWQQLRRLQTLGVTAQTVIDVGASVGVWSAAAAKVFPNAHFVMVDPLMSRYDEESKKYYHNQVESFQLVDAALSDQSGEMEFLVSDDLYGSSLLKVDEGIRKADKAKVKVLTLDDLAQQNEWQGPVVLKIDVQFAEHLVIAGGANFVRSRVDALILELTIHREHPDAKTYREMLDLMSELGYELVDETDGWRCPRTGRLEQKDSVFLKRERCTWLHDAA